ncbi:MAG: hypothetical protein IPI58_09155 [Alphaproteobacteria bacterium]|nr:MAG: hypothetical protein IPI58_09155 [Alphaproteobacteria bacterium]
MRPWLLSMVLVLLAASAFWDAYQGVLHLKLVNTDDYMRLVQVERWRAGQDWSDMREPRLNPPEGVRGHWGRLPDIAIAGVMTVVEHLPGHLDPLRVAMTVVPLLMLLILLAMLDRMRRNFPGTPSLLYVALALISMRSTIFQFQPGRVDHHSFSLIMLAVAFAALLRLAARPHAWGWAVAGGLALAMGLWESLEVLPWAAVALVILGGLMLWRGRLMASAGLIWALTLFLAACAIWRTQFVPIYGWTGGLDVLCLPVIAGLWAALLVTALLAIGSRWGWSWRARLVVTSGLGCGLLAMLAAAFPAFFRDPFAGLDPLLARYWLSRINEVTSPWAMLMRGDGLILAFDHITSATANLAVPVALIILIWRGAKAWKQPGRQAPDLAALVIMGVPLIIGMICAMAYQSRFTAFAQFFAILPFALALQTFARLGDRLALSSGQLLAFKVGMVAALSPVLVVMPPRALLSAILPPPKTVAPACSVDALALVLNDPRGMGDRSRLILANIDLGPELLFRTRHSVLAAPYHRNVEGNRDALLALMGTPDQDNRARQIMRQRGVDIVALCAGAVTIPMGQNDNSLEKRLTYTKLPTHWAQTPLALQQVMQRSGLVALDVPEWLQPMSLPPESGMVLFEVVKDRL